MGVPVSILMSFGGLKSDPEQGESSCEPGSYRFGTEAHSIIAEYGRLGDRHPTAFVSPYQPTQDSDTDHVVSEGKVDADGDQIMGTATVHNSQFTQSLLLFVSLTFSNARNAGLAHEFPPLVPNSIRNQVHPVFDEVLLLAGGRYYDETHPREFAEFQCQVPGFRSSHSGR